MRESSARRGWIAAAGRLLLAVATASAALPAAVSAQHVLTGRVTAAGAPLAGARLELRLAADSSSGPSSRALARAVTGAGGRYELGGIAAGSYLVVVSRLGYEPARPPWQACAGC